MLRSTRFSSAGWHLSKKARNLDVSSNQDIIDARPFLEARVQYNLPVPQEYFRIYCPFLRRTTCPLPFGAELGRFRDVPAYSCHYESADPLKYKSDWDYMSYYNFQKGVITSTGGKEFLCVNCSNRIETTDDKKLNPNTNPNIVSGDSLQHIAFDDLSNHKTIKQKVSKKNSKLSSPTSSSTSSSPSTKQIGIYLGHMFQCVMASRFWLVKTYGLTFQDVAMAYDIFELNHFYRILHVGETSKEHKMEKVPVLKVKNDGKIPVENEQVMKSELYKKPLPGNILIWEEGGFFRYTGHVAVVTEVVEKEVPEEVTIYSPSASYAKSNSKDDDVTAKVYQCTHGVRIWEQNVNDESWNGRNYSRELPAYYDKETGAFVIVETIWKSKVKGWMATLCMIEHEKEIVAKY